MTEKLTEQTGAYGDQVAAQYEKWVYPEPIQDIEQWSRDFRDAGDPSVMHYAYWPDRDYKEGMKILVAGCGANEAATYAFRNPKAAVTGIDVSESSLQHADFLRRKHGLSNLTLKQMSIEDSPALGSKFDLIVATGVLHHLEDPARGLKALVALLEQDGVIEIMLYGKYARTGVYMMQDLFRRLGLGQTPDDVEAVKSTLEILPSSHFVRLYLNSSVDLGSDTGFVDTFLSRRDRAYSVADCMQLLDDCDLEFQGWIENGLYYPDAQINPGRALYKRLQDLPAREVWEIMELFSGKLFRHVFYACRRDRPKPSYALDLDGEALWDYVPMLRDVRFTPQDEASNRPATLERLPVRAIPLDDAQFSMYSQLDGVYTVREAMLTAGILAEPDVLAAFARNFIKSLWRLGFAHLRF